MARALPTATDCHDLMDARVAGLFQCDEDGRTLALNQWDGGEPPRFHLARTAGGQVCRVRRDVPEHVAAELRRLAAAEPLLEDPRSPPARLADYLALLNGPGTSEETWSGPVFWFRSEPVDQGTTALVGPANAHLLRDGLDEWLPDVPHRQPLVVALEDGRAVSVCASVRITERAHEAGVETVPDYRGRGHAAAATAAWARAVRRRGVAVRFYSTSWDNGASQGVAARLGLTLIGVDFSIA